MKSSVKISGIIFLKRQDLSKMDKKTLKIYRLEENNEA